jgi:hypothetical protein
MVEDMLCDGLVAIPAKGQLLTDTVSFQAAKHVFDGAIADPKKKSDKRITREDYMKAFSEADAEYQHLLAMLLSGLRQTASALGTGPGLR